LKVLLVDDEPAMLLAMRMLLTKMEGVELVGSFRHAAEAIEWMQADKVDLAFLDIQLVNESGLELAKRLRELDPELNIVFTTSHTEFSMQAYDVYPLDYMVKPISRKRLTQTIARATARHAAGVHTDKAKSALLAISGLGCFAAVSKQASNVKWISRKSKEVFAYLLMYQGRNIHKERMLEDIFGNMPYRNAEVYLNTAVYQLRKTLAEHGYKEVILSAQEKYRVDIEQLDVDFIRFEQAADRLMLIDETNEAIAIELERQYTGELFEDTSFDWAMAERDRLSGIYIAFAMRLTEWLRESKKYREAAYIAARMVVRNEFDEECNLVLLRLYAAIGDRQSLQAHYVKYRTLLQEELGIEPSPLFEQVYLETRTCDGLDPDEEDGVLDPRN